MRKNKRYLRGALTVEASFVTLILLATVVILLVIGIYLHDVSYLHATAQYHANNIATDLMQDSEEGKLDWSLWEQKDLLSTWAERFRLRKDGYEQRLDRTLGRGMLIPCEDITYQIAYYDNSVWVNLSAYYRFPLYDLVRIATHRRSIPVFVRAKSRVFSEEGLLRQLQSLFHVVEQVK